MLVGGLQVSLQIKAKQKVYSFRFVLFFVICKRQQHHIWASPFCFPQFFSRKKMSFLAKNICCLVQKKNFGFEKEKHRPAKREKSFFLKKK